MKIERDIDRTKKLSEENRSFRSFLKSSKIPSKKNEIWAMDDFDEYY